MTEELKEQDIRLNKLCFAYQDKDKALKDITELYEKCSDEMRRLGKVVQEKNKQIAELEADNKEWEKASDKWKANYFELEKENTELKERVSTFEQIKKEHTAYTIKVEEIIKNLIDDLEVIDGEQIRELEDVKEAEQLLKDSEVNK